MFHSHSTNNEMRSLSSLPSTIVRYLSESYLLNKESCAIGSTSHQNLNSMRQFRIGHRISLGVAIRLAKEEMIESVMNGMQARGESDGILTRSRHNRYRRVMKKITFRCGRRPSSLLLQNHECKYNLRYMSDHMATSVRSIKFDESAKQVKVVFPSQITELLIPKFTLLREQLISLPTLRRIVFAQDKRISFSGIKSDEWPKDLTALENVLTLDADTSRWCLPPSLRTLTFNILTKTTFHPSFLSATLPSSLTHLALPPTFQIPKEGCILPSGLQTIIFPPNCSPQTQHVTFPKSLRHLDCNSYEYSLENVPVGLKTLRLNWGFKETFTPFTLSNTITELNLPRNYSQLTSVATTFPSQLKKLSVEMTSERHALALMNLPPSLRELSLKVCAYSWVIDLKQVTLPAWIESLTLDYSEPTYGSVSRPDLSALILPSALRYLKFEGKFNESLEKIKWPRSFMDDDGSDNNNEKNQSHSLHIDLGSSFCQPIHAGHLPSSCTSLRLGRLYVRPINFDLTNFVLPPRVHTIEFASEEWMSTVFLQFPDQVRTIYYDTIKSFQCARASSPITTAALTAGNPTTVAIS